MSQPYCFRFYLVVAVDFSHDLDLSIEPDLGFDLELDVHLDINLDVDFDVTTQLF